MKRIIFISLPALIILLVVDVARIQASWTFRSEAVRFGAMQLGALQSGDQQTASQPLSVPSSALATLRRDFKHSMPLPVGEKLIYDVKISRFPLYASVGVVTFEFLGPIIKQNLKENATDQSSKESSKEALIEGLN